MYTPPSFCPRAEAMAFDMVCGSEVVDALCHARVNVKGVVGLHRSLGDRDNHGNAHNAYL